MRASKLRLRAACCRVVFGEEFVIAARQLGLKSITVVRSERMSPDEFRLYAANVQKVLDMGEFDEAVLSEELKELEKLLGSERLTDLAFEEGELTRLLGLDTQVIEEKAQVEKSEAPGICASGDLWIAGNHRYLCASALDPASYRVLMADDGPYCCAIGLCCELGAVLANDL